MSVVALDRKIFAPRVSHASQKAPENQGSTTERVSRAGVLFAVAGMFLLTLSAGDVLAGAVSGGDRGDGLRGPGIEEKIYGTDGVDFIYGLSGDDGIFGGKGADEVYGGPGRDVMLGGPGDDFIEAKDGAGDFVGCGSGHDVVSVDEKDLVSRDCEVVYRA